MDGDYGTRWASEWVDTAWVQVDLGSVQSFNRVLLAWEAAYAEGYTVQVSDNGSTWQTIHTATGGTGRYVRVSGTARATDYGYSLWEFGIYRI